MRRRAPIFLGSLAGLLLILHLQVSQGHATQASIAPSHRQCAQASAQPIRTRPAQVELSEVEDPSSKILSREQLFDSYLQVLGGKSRIEKLHTLIVHQEIMEQGRANLLQTNYYAQPYKMREEWFQQGQPILTIGLEQDKAWFVVQIDRPKQHAMPGAVGAASEMKRQIDGTFYLPDLKNLEDQYDVEMEGTTTFDNKSAYTLVLVSKFNCTDSETLWFDKKTFLLLARSSVRGRGTSWEHTRYSDYRSASDKVPISANYRDWRRSPTLH